VGESYVSALKNEELAPGGMKTVDVKGHEIVVCMGMPDLRPWFDGRGSCPGTSTQGSAVGARRRWRRMAGLRRAHRQSVPAPSA
jgi:hypothetical protein